MGEHDSDIPFSAKQHIDRLLRRVLMLMFAVGVLAVLAIWAMEAVDGTIEPTNRIAYPAQVVLFSASLAALWRCPATLRFVRWIGFLSFTVSLSADLWVQVHEPVAMVANYNAVTLLDWLPICYVIAFFMLEARQAFAAAAAILAFFVFCTVLRGHAATVYAAQDRALMANTLVSHIVLLACLTGLLWLKHVVRVQGEQSVRLTLLAATDPLTGLANRRSTLRRIDALASENRPELAPVILLIDLDHFKRINDRFGHEVGDQVLTAVAGALRAGVREADLVARWGGEEFLVLLPRTRAGEAAELAERLRARTEAMGLADRLGRPVPVTMSVGIAALSRGETGATWLRRADEALYDAKAAGRNRVIAAL